jgi:hypothetical protein
LSPREHLIAQNDSDALHLLLAALRRELISILVHPRTTTHFANAMQFFFLPKEKLTPHIRSLSETKSKTRAYRLHIPLKRKTNDHPHLPKTR